MSPGVVPLSIPQALTQYAGSILTALHVVIQVALIPLVIIRRKEASSTIAWILTLVFLPLAGAFLFLLFGRDRVRLGATRKRRAKAASRARIRGVVSGARGTGARTAGPSEGTADRAGPSDPGVEVERRDHEGSVAGLAAPVTEVSSEVALAFAEAELEERLTRLDPVDRPIFRVGGRLGHMAATTGNAITLMNGGSEAIDAKLEAIEAALRSVHAEYYLVRDDTTGRRFRDVLIAAARRGVRVRLLLDGYGGLALGSSYVDAFRDAGVELARFLPIRALGAGLHARILGAFQWNLRNHRKILVIDGRIGFTGGVNIGDDVRTWRDTHVRIEGQAVHSLQGIFLEDWEFATGTTVAERTDFPSFPPHAPPHQPPQASAPSEASPDGVGAARDGGGGPAGVVEVVASGPDTANEAVHRVFFAAITGARSRVMITTPYFVPDRSLLVALQTAALSGVDVKLIVPAVSNHKVTAAAGRSYYEEILEAGVGIYEYAPGMIHAKTIVVDGRIALVGSANMDMRSFRLNYEVHTVIRDGATAARLERTFDEDLAKTRRLDLAEWRARGTATRVAEGLGRLVAPLL